MSFDTPGTHDRPGPIGRGVRLIAGLVMFYFITPPALFHHHVLIREGWHPDILRWSLGIILAIYLLPAVVDRVFTLDFGRRSQIVLVVAVAAAVVSDLIFYGTFWAPPLGIITLLTFVFSLGLLALSFVVSGLLATPG